MYVRNVPTIPMGKLEEVDDAGSLVAGRGQSGSVDEVQHSFDCQITGLFQCHLSILTLSGVAVEQTFEVRRRLLQQQSVGLKDTTSATV